MHNNDNNNNDDDINDINDTYSFNAIIVLFQGWNKISRFSKVSLFRFIHATCTIAFMDFRTKEINKIISNLKQKKNRIFPPFYNYEFHQNIAKVIKYNNVIHFFF